MLRKIVEKLRQGMLRDIIRETQWIYGYAVGYRKGIAVYILLGLLATALSLGGSVVSKYLIDAVTGHRNELLAKVIALYVGCGLAKIAVNAVIRRVSAKLNVRAANEIRADVFGKFLEVDWQASLDYHSGDLLSRINSDVTTVSDSILGWIPNLVTGSVQFVGILIIILVYDPLMALLALASAPVTVLLSRMLLPRMRTFGQEVRERQAQLTAFYEESLQNLQAIKSFHLTEKFSGRLDELQMLYRDVSLNYNIFSVKTNLLLSVTGFAVSLLCFGWGAYRLWSGYITFGTMVLFIQMAGMLASAFSGLVALIPAAVSATVSAGRIMTILELPREEEKLTEEAQTVLEKAADCGIAVRTEQVRFAYRNGQTVFDGLDLYAAPGEIIGVVSPSGGGKTTLIRLLLGLIKPDAGQVVLESGGTSALLVPGLRPLISYVAQEKVVFSGTIAEALRLAAPLATKEQLQQALKLACAWDFVSALPQGMDTPLGERGNGLSEGQIQRLAIARALVSEAPLLLLDEATSALDLNTERQVLHNMLHDNRRTVIVTTHRPTVLRSCSRVYSLTGGRAVLLTAEQICDLTKDRI